IDAVKRAVRSLALIVSTVMLTPVCLPQSSACCLKKGSAVGMKWFHCSSETVAPEIATGAVVGLAAAAGAVVGAAAGAVVGFAAAAGAVVGAAAGAVVGAAAGTVVGLAAAAGAVVAGGGAAA